LALQPLCWVLVAFSISWFYTQSAELLGRGISLSQGLYLHTGQRKHRINAQNADINALNAIRTHDPSVQESEDSSCFRPRGHCDRHRGLQADCKYSDVAGVYKSPQAIWSDTFTEK
jgi:hypothetical protein